MIVITIPLIGIGASKGSIVALALSLLVIFFVNRKVNFRFLILFIFSFLVIYNAELLFLGTLKDRFTHSLDVNLYSSERELRYYLWNFSIDKFIDNPIFGYSLEISNNDLEILSSPAYSHNIILESLLSLGFIGGSVLVIIIIIMTINNGIYIAKNKLDESWILLLFLIAFYQNMFIGNLYSGAIWFWFFVCLINGRYKYLQLQKADPYILPKN